jgi:hypothetical protein
MFSITCMVLRKLRPARMRTLFTSPASQEFRAIRCCLENYPGNVASASVLDSLRLDLWGGGKEPLSARCLATEYSDGGFLVALSRKPSAPPVIVSGRWGTVCYCNRIFMRMGAPSPMYGLTIEHKAGCRKSVRPPGKKRLRNKAIF